MSAVTVARDQKAQPGDLVEVVGSSGYNYLAGTIAIRLTTAGVIAPLTIAAGTSGAYFAGIVEDNLNLTSGGSTGTMRVRIKGVVEMEAQGTPATTDLFRPIYGVDNATVGASSAGTQVGTVVSYTATKYRVLISNRIGL